MAADTPKVYAKIRLTDYFHGFPHINFHLREVNSTFNPENEDYRQSLELLCLVPVAVCLVLWLVYLIYFACRCCHTPTAHARGKQRSSGCCLSGFIYTLVIVSIGLTGFGFFQNENTHDGIGGVASAVENINSTINSSTTETENNVEKERTCNPEITLVVDRVYHQSINVSNLDAISDNIVNVWAQSMEDSIDTLPDSPVKTLLHGRIEDLRKQAAKARTTLDVVNGLEKAQGYLSDFDDSVDTVEHYRWTGTIAVLIVYSALFFCILIGMLRHWRTLLIFNAVCGVILAVIFWAGFGVYLGSSVGLGDFCTNPNAFFVKELTDSDVAAQFMVYFECKDPATPYQSDILEAQAAITQASSALDVISRTARPLLLPGFDDILKEVQNNLQMAQGNVSSLLINVGLCTTAHNYYIDGVNSACVDSMQSVAFLLMVTIMLALTTAVLMFLISCVWGQKKKRTSHQYLQEDDTDPFLPRPPPYEQDYGSIARASPRAWSERGALRAQHPSVNEENVMFMRHQHQPTGEESPPPAYQSGQFSIHHLEAALSSNHGRPRNQ